MSLQWDESLVLGLEVIDNQHRAIVENFQKLSEAIQQGAPTEGLEQLSIFLCDYAAVHFTSEEKIMVDYGYPKIGTQRHEHQLFTQDAKKLREQIKEAGVSREFAIEATGKLFRWIIQHIKNHDKEMIDYVKERLAHGE